MIIDTHSHIYDEAFIDDIDDIIIRAKNNGVDKILLPNIDTDTISNLNKLVDKYENECIPMMGLHPTSVTLDWKKDLEIIKNEFSKRKYYAVGEIGMDLYWDKTLKQQQQLAFEEQLKWSIEFNLPISIHSREAVMECIESIHKVGADKIRGIFHSFGGDLDELKEILKLPNFYIGVNGTITYKNSKLPEILGYTDLKKLVVETDAPYLPPVPFRGKRNEPAYTTYIIQKLSEIYKKTKTEVENITTSNAKIIFGLQ